MKSLITKIIGACLGLSLATGVGVGIVAGQREVKEANAAEEVTYTLDGTQTGGSSAYASESAITQNSITWGVIGNTTQNPWRIGGKSLSNVNREIYSKEKVSSYDISKVTIDVGTASGVTVNSLTLKVGTAQKGSQTSTVTGTFKASSTITFNRPSGADWANKFFDIIFNVTVTNNSDNKFIQFKNAKFYKDSSEASLQSLEITGNLTKTSFVFGEAWNHNGLSLVGHYSDNTTKAVTSGVSWSYNPGCTNVGVTSLTITAAAEGKTATYTTDVTITKVASPYVNGVPYKMFLHNSNDYYFTGSINDNHYGTTTSDSSSTDIVIMYFEPSNDGQALYFYAGNDASTAKQYIYIAKSGSYINFLIGTTPSTFYYNGKTMVMYVSGADGIYGMGTYSTYTTFGASASYSNSNYFAQFSLVNPLTAEDFANQFLDIVTCDSTGETAPTYKYNYSWQSLNDLFDQLDTTEQNTLKAVDISGTDVVAQAMAKYNLIVAKYGYTNFVNRTISNVSNRIMNINGNSEVTIVVISMIAIVMSSVLAFYFFKKKKFNR